MLRAGGGGGELEVEKACRQGEQHREGQAARSLRMSH